MHFFSQKDLQKSLNIYSSALKQDIHETILLEGAHTFCTGTQISCLTMTAPFCISALSSNLISGVIYLLFVKHDSCKSQKQNEMWSIMKRQIIMVTWTMGLLDTSLPATSCCLNHQISLTQIKWKLNFLFQ